MSNCQFKVFTGTTTQFSFDKGCYKRGVFSKLSIFDTLPFQGEQLTQKAGYRTTYKESKVVAISPVKCFCVIFLVVLGYCTKI